MYRHSKYVTAKTKAELANNLSDIYERIAQACKRAGRDVNTVRVLPVSKTIDIERIVLLHELGFNYFGENKVQEAKHKSEQLAESAINWSVIGHLQTNKIKYVAKFAAEFQALDSVKVAKKLSQRLAIENREMDVLIQVNTSNEDSKYGLQPIKVANFIHEISELPNIRIKGLMTLAMLSEHSAKVRDCFVRLRQLRDELLVNLPNHMSLYELSMGMSGDFEIAIEEGATIVRIGQAIFGARQTSDEFYWPKG